MTIQERLERLWGKNEKLRPRTAEGKELSGGAIGFCIELEDRHVFYMPDDIAYALIGWQLATEGAKVGWEFIHLPSGFCVLGHGFELPSNHDPLLVLLAAWEKREGIACA